MFGPEDQNLKPQSYTVRIDGETFRVSESTPTGRKLLQLVGRDPSEFFLVFLIQGEPDQIVELEEPFNLQRPEVEEFILVSKTRHFTILIDETGYTVSGPFITGKLLLAVAGKDPATHLLTQVIVGADDIFIDPDEEVDLSAPGREHFTVVAKESASTHCKVEIDGKEHPWTKDTITTEEIIMLGGFDPKDGVLLIDADNVERTLQPGEVVRLDCRICFSKKVRFRRG